MSTTNAKVTDVSPLEQRFVKSEKKYYNKNVGKWNSHNEVDIQTSAIKHNAGACADANTLYAVGFHSWCSYETCAYT